MTTPAMAKCHTPFVRRMHYACETPALPRFQWWHPVCSLSSRQLSMPNSINTASAEPGPLRHRTVRTRAHPYCVVCSQSNPLGLGLEFSAHSDGSVSASFYGHAALEGYEGCLHGGMIASLLDGAMTNCLFAQGHVAMTAELKVRYRKPVFVGQEMIVRAWIARARAPLYLVEAELKQEGCVKAAASAKFIEQNERADHSHRPGRE